jgi:ABC-type transporter MlaC component
MSDEPPPTQPAARPLTRRAHIAAGAAAVAAAVLLAEHRPAAAQTSPADPQRFVTGLAERAFEILRETSGPERERALAASSTAASTCASWPGSCSAGTGTAATEAQRAEYVDLFRAYALQGLTSALANYTGRERLTVGGSRPASEQDVLVSTELASRAARPTGSSGASAAPASGPWSSTSSSRA